MKKKIRILLLTLALAFALSSAAAAAGPAETRTFTVSDVKSGEVYISPEDADGLRFEQSAHGQYVRVVSGKEPFALTNFTVSVTADFSDPAVYADTDGNGRIDTIYADSVRLVWSVASVNDFLNSIVWGVPMLVLIISVGILLTIRTRGIQFRRFGYAMRNTVGKLFVKQTAGKGEITPFQALSTAMAGTVGTGNISGIIAAVTLGGPGSLFWLWVMALIGMCTKYCEVLLSIRYRERNQKGEWVGGPMYYIKNGLGKKWNWLAYLFCVFGALAAFGIGNAVQVGNITDAVATAVKAFAPAGSYSVGAVNWTVGIIVAAVAGLTLLGGIKRMGRVAEMLVPFMSIIYIVSCLVVIFANISYIGQVFASIFRYAFSASAILGGTAAYAIKKCMTWGFKRGVFSNEAGLGSAPIAHATTSETDPVKQGFYGIFEVFMDTIVICSLTGLTILICDYASPDFNIVYGVKGGNSVIVDAFATVMGGKAGSLLIAIGITLFALSTILGWALYGTRCCEYLLGEKSVRPFQIVFVAFCIIGATMSIDLAWNIADTLNGLMAIPNLIAVVALSGVIVSVTKEHFKRRESALHR